MVRSRTVYSSPDINSVVKPMFQNDVSTGVQYGGSGGFSPMADLGLLDPGVAGGLSGFVQTVLQPGVIVDLPLSNVALSKDGRAPRHS